MTILIAGSLYLLELAIPGRNPSPHLLSSWALRWEGKVGEGNLSERLKAAEMGAQKSVEKEQRARRSHGSKSGAKSASSNPRIAGPGPSPASVPPQRFSRSCESRRGLVVCKRLLLAFGGPLVSRDILQLSRCSRPGKLVAG